MPVGEDLSLWLTKNPAVEKTCFRFGMEQNVPMTGNLKKIPGRDVYGILFLFVLLKLSTLCFFSNESINIFQNSTAKFL